MPACLGAKQQLHLATVSERLLKVNTNVLLFLSLHCLLYTSLLKYSTFSAMFQSSTQAHKLYLGFFAGPLGTHTPTPDGQLLPRSLGRAKKSTEENVSLFSKQSFVQ